MASFTVKAYRGAYKRPAQEVRVTVASETERRRFVGIARTAGWDSAGWSEPGLAFGMTSDDPANIDRLVTALEQAGATNSI